MRITMCSYWSSPPPTPPRSSSPKSAQVAPRGAGAVWGVVSDAGIGLPGATVVATWESDGEAVLTEVQTALDGGYVLCGVPRGVEVSVQPVLVGVEGATAVTTLTGDFARVDLSWSLTGGGGDDRLWACLDSRVDPEGRIERLRLFRCDADWNELDACAREELGEVEAVLASSSRTVAVRASDVAALQAQIADRGLRRGAARGDRGTRGGREATRCQRAGRLADA